MSDRAAFDPTKYLTKVSGRDYLEVKWRVVWFNDVHPTGSIETEMVWHQNNAAIFRAVVSWTDRETSDRVSRTGWGSESSDDFGDYLEKAETKALGRALAAAGFGTQFCPDFDFGADRQRVVDSPVDIRSGRSASSGARQEATPRQIKYLYAVAREAGIGSDELEERCQDAFGCSVGDLSRRDVSAMIEQVQAGRPASPIADARASAAAQVAMPVTPSGSAGPITAQQKSTINNLLDPLSVDEAARRMFGRSLTQLTTEEAEELIQTERRVQAARN